MDEQELKRLYMDDQRLVKLIVQYGRCLDGIIVIHELIKSQCNIEPANIVLAKFLDVSTDTIEGGFSEYSPETPGTKLISNILSRLQPETGAARYFEELVKNIGAV